MHNDLVFRRRSISRRLACFSADCRQKQQDYLLSLMTPQGSSFLLFNFNIWGKYWNLEEYMIRDTLRLSMVSYALTLIKSTEHLV